MKFSFIFGLTGWNIGILWSHENRWSLVAPLPGIAILINW